MSPNGEPKSALVPTNERFRPFALAGLILLTVGLCVLLSVPFLPALTWSVALAIMAWPLHAWISRRIPQPNLAAGLSSAIVVLLVLIPVLFVTYQLAREAGAASDHMGEGIGSNMRDRLEAIPGLGGIVDWFNRIGLDVEQEARTWIASYTASATAFLQGSVDVVLQSLVALFILFHLFRDRAQFVRGVRDLLPLSRAESDRVFASVADSVHANLYATVVTSCIDAAGGGLMFWALGLPSPVLWSVVMFVLSLLPVVGAGMVWAPAIAYLVLNGQWLSALLLLGWGLGSWFVVDNIIYVRLAGERMRMHQAPTLVAFLGGLAVFGVSGMILGPAILAVTVALLDVWRRREAGPERIPNPAKPLYVPSLEIENTSA